MMYSIVIVVALAIVALPDIANSQDANCLRCICQVEGCNSQIGRCRMDMGSLSCGPYQIKEAYWIDAGRPGIPGEGWQQCTRQKACSEQCIRNYMNRYARTCTGVRNPNCKDYAKIHNEGPDGCKSSNNDYWNRVNRCLG